MSGQPTDKQIQTAYAAAKERYAALGVDTDAALDTLSRISISLHCWQGDDVGGFESPDAELGGGLPATGNYPGKARKVRDLVNEYVDENQEVPKTILMQNHGLIALGHTPREVENITAMAVKAASVLQGAYAFGGPHFLSSENVQRIHTRPDEEYRRRGAEGSTHRRASPTPHPRG